MEVSDARYADAGTQSSVGEASSAHHRILAATGEVLSRVGASKLSLSQVALQAGLSRPTLYRRFGSKENLLEAFAGFEQRRFEQGLRAATADLNGSEKLVAALRFIVDYRQVSWSAQTVGIEPAGAIQQLSRVIPSMRAQLQCLLSGSDGPVKAAAAVRVVISHYIVVSDDADQFLAQLRHTVGIKHQ